MATLSSTSARGARWRVPLVFVCVYVVLTTAASGFGELYLRAWLPIFRWELDATLQSRLASASLTLTQTGGQRLIVYDVLTTVPLRFGRTTAPAGTGFYSSTLQAYALHHAIIVFAMLAAWPVRSLRRRWLLLALGVPCVLVTTSLDIPFVLTGQFQELFVAGPAVGPLPWDARTLYYSFLHAGGRLGLAIVAATAVALCATHAGRAESRRPARESEPLG